MSNDKKYLIEKLYGQLQQNASDSHLLITARMLVAALQSADSLTQTTNVTVISPIMSETPATDLLQDSAMEAKEKITARAEEPVSEATPLKKKKINHSKLIEKELSFFEIYREEDSSKTTIQQTLFKDMQDDMVEVNERLKRNKKEIAENQPVNDLKSAIGINDRYLYINELFRGDATVYERSIYTINNFSSLKDSMEWIERTLRLTYFWDEDSKTVQQFYHVVKRRFS